MTSRIRLVGLSTATAKQQHRPRSTKLGAPSLWEVSIDPVDTPEGPAPLRGGFGGQGNQERDYSYVCGKPPHFLGALGQLELLPAAAAPWRTWTSRQLRTGE